MPTGKDISYATTLIIAERIAPAQRQWEKREERQLYANWCVQTTQRQFGGALTFAQLHRSFIRAGFDYDQGARRVVEVAA